MVVVKVKLAGAADEDRRRRRGYRQKGKGPGVDLGGKSSGQGLLWYLAGAVVDVGKSGRANQRALKLRKKNQACPRSNLPNMALHWTAQAAF